MINGLKVLGSTEALPTPVPALGIAQVIITIADDPQAQLRRILSLCERIPVRAQMIPAMCDLLQGKVSISELREVRVEDLLHRETVSLEENDLVGFDETRHPKIFIGKIAGVPASELDAALEEPATGPGRRPVDPSAPPTRPPGPRDDKHGSDLGCHHPMLVSGCVWGWDCTRGS